ncbi:MAG: eukaryotic-like serine/threonine-protein kinase [Blastocatellia bacterium]|jgi:serine/threonine protein kinase|nr:eukaryotic-like serine/threonine-protein kinase [Blastocatellia bacterium]
MNIATGTLLGRYEIRTLIGAGGMGEVYRAHDSSLRRDVAIKVLFPQHALNADRLQRFEQEARATSVLNHPNIVAIFDFGSFNGSPYIVSELLNGETLRDRLIQSALPTRKAIDYASQIARGLGAAHDKGIVHRDLKPENVFLTTDGHAKILDFGLAKLIEEPVSDEDSSSEVPTKRVSTQPGTVLGSVGYMSPEQVRGRATDSRSDIFSFGAVLYEMVTGDRAFRGDSSVETMNAILKDEPPPIEISERTIAPALERFITHCLEKQPQDRYQSARDLAFNLESITSDSGVSSSMSGTRVATATKNRRWPIFAAIALVLAGLLALVFFLERKSFGTQLPTYTQLTFRRGSIYTARFTPDGKGIYFSATWNGNPLDISSMRVESPEVQSLGAMPYTQLLSISPAGEMAVLLKSKWLFHYVNAGTLARMPLTGGAPREILEHVQEADWSPTGGGLA